MRRDVPECRLRDDEGGMTTLGFLLRLALLAILLGAVYAAVTLLPQILGDRRRRSSHVGGPFVTRSL